MKPEVVLLCPPGLNGAIGAAAGLLKAAIRSLNEFDEGFSATGGAAFKAGAGAGADFGEVVEANGGGAGSVCLWLSSGVAEAPSNSFGGLISASFTCSGCCGAASGSSRAGGVSEGGSGAAVRLGVRAGLEGIAGSYFSTKLRGNNPSFLSPEALVYSPVYQSSS